MTHSTLAPALVDRILLRLALDLAPTVDHAGLSRLYAAFSEQVPFDNVAKRIAIAANATAPYPLMEPTAFFEHWLAHGTGGTCWPINEALHALIVALGFDARRITGSILVPTVPTEWLGSNHGSVVVTLDEHDYLVDGWIAGFEPLPLDAGATTSTSHSLHRVSAVPTDGVFLLDTMPGFSRDVLRLRTEPETEAVTGADFGTLYERTRQVAFFNDSLFAVRRFPDRIVTVGRDNVVTIDALGAVTRTPVSVEERGEIMRDEMGYSPEIVAALPPDSTRAPARL